MEWDTGLMLLGQSANSGAGGVMSIWDFCVKGGPVMIPIGICSLVALTVTIERLASLRRGRVIPPTFLSGLKALLGAGREPSAALDYCRRDASPVANVFAAGIKRLGEPIDVLERHIEEAGQREVRGLRKNLRVLAVIASVATLLGLLGTIFGMITAFQTVASAPEALGKTELLARGIYEALITTAAGLIVAIPATIFYHAFAARVEALVAEIDRVAEEFVEEFARSRPPTAAPAATRIAPLITGHADVPQSAALNGAPPAAEAVAAA